MRIKTINSAILLCACGLLVLQVPASADILEAEYQCNSNNVVQVVSPLSGPLNVPFSCSGTDIADGTVFVNPLPGNQGSSVTFGGGLVVVDTLATDLLTISSSTLPLGTPIMLTAYSTLSGTYSYSVPAGGYVVDVVSGDVTLSGNGQFTEGSYLSNNRLYFCSPSSPLGLGCPGAISTSGSGSLSVPLVAGHFYTTIGSFAQLELDTEQEFEFQGSFTGDFADPVTFTVTDPNTGALLSGITITGDTGAYVVNPTYAPEPSSLGLLALPALALIAVRLRSSGSSKHAQQTI